MSRRQQVREHEERSRISEKRHKSQLDPASASPLPFSPDPWLHWEGSTAHPGCRQRPDSRICVGSPREQRVAHRKRQQQVCKDGTIMKVRHLVLSPWDELRWGYVNAVPVFYPYLTPSLSPPSLLYLCSVLPTTALPTSVSLHPGCLFPFLRVPSLSHLNPPPPDSLTRTTCCLRSHETFLDRGAGTSVSRAVLWTCSLNQCHFLGWWNQAGWQTSASMQQVLNPLLSDETYITLQLQRKAMLSGAPLRFAGVSQLPMRCDTM